MHSNAVVEDFQIFKDRLFCGFPVFVVPAYVIFLDSTLRGTAQMRPSSLPELAQVGGIGTGKLERYGEQVLEAVAAVAVA